MSSVSLVKAELFCLTFRAVFQFSSHTHWCVLENGAILNMWRIVILKWQLGYPKFQLMQKKVVWLADGILFFSSSSSLVFGHWFSTLLWFAQNPLWVFKPTQSSWTRTNPYPYPWRQVGVCAGKGTGNPGKPQGYLWQSLITVHLTPPSFSLVSPTHQVSQCCQSA